MIFEEPKEVTEKQTITVYIDGAAKPNPGRGGCGIVIRSENFDYKLSVKMSQKKVSGIDAEYYALLIAFMQLEQNNCYDEDITIISDSEVLVKQMNDETAPELDCSYVKYYDQAIRTMIKFINISFEHVTRENNTEANELASKAVNLPDNKMTRFSGN